MPWPRGIPSSRREISTSRTRCGWRPTTPRVPSNWRRVSDVGAVTAFSLNRFVLIVQSFPKVPVLKVLTVSKIMARIRMRRGLNSGSP